MEPSCLVDRNRVFQATENDMIQDTVQESLREQVMRDHDRLRLLDKGLVD